MLVALMVLLSLVLLPLPAFAGSDSAPPAAEMIEELVPEEIADCWRKGAASYR